MIEALLLLLACQMVGEAAARALVLPVPGPVIGMALLFAGLIWRERRQRRIGRSDEKTTELPGALGTVADGLLQNLSLLFVPAAVGIVQHFTRVRDHAFPIALALMVSTIVTMVVTVLVFDRVRRFGKSEP